MPDTLLRIIEKLLDYTKGAVCVAVGILLALYALRVNAFNLYTLYSLSIVYPAVTFIVFIVSGTFFLREVISQLTRRVNKVIAERKVRNAAYDTMRSLTNEQKEMLQLLVASPNHSEYFVYSGNVKELVTSRIIVSRHIELEAK